MIRIFFFIILLLFNALSLFGALPLLKDDEALSFSVDIKGYTNGGYMNSIPDISDKTKFYLNFEDFAQQMVIKINTTNNDIISGYVGDSKNTFVINLNNQTIIYKKKTTNLSINDYGICDNQIYISNYILEQIFNLKININRSRLTMLIDSSETLPIEILGSANEKRQFLTNKKEENTNNINYTQDDDYFKAPSIDFYTRETYNKNLDSSTLFNSTGLYLGGVFLGFDANLNTIINQSANSYTTSSNLLFTKNNAGNLKYGINYLNFGDTYSYNTALIDTGSAGLGFNITSLDSYNLNFNRTIDLDGSIPDGYDVELYQNGMLIAVMSSQNGRYLFKNIPVNIGINNFILIFYGPFGEKTTEEKNIYIDSNPVKKNQFGFKLSSINPYKSVLPNNNNLNNINKFTSTGTIYYGITDSITLDASYSLQPLDNVMYSFYQMGTLFSLGSFSFGYNIASRENYSKIAQEFSIYGSIFNNSSLYISYNDFNGIQSNQSLNDNKYIKDQFGIRYNDYIFKLPFELGYKKIKYDENIDSYNINYQNEMYIKTGKTILSYIYAGLEDNFTQSNLYQSNQLIAYLDFNISHYSIKATATKDFNYAQAITSSSITIDYHLNEIFYSFFSFNSSYISQSSYNTYSSGLSYNSSIGSFSLQLSYFNANSYNIGLIYSIGLGYDKNQKNIYVSTQNSLTNTSTIIATIFIDNNNNNIFDKDIDEPIEKAALLINNVPYESNISNNNGTIYIKGITPYIQTDVSLNPTSIEDIMLVINNNKYHKILRPSVSTYIDFPLNKSGDLEGIINIPKGINIKEYNIYLENIQNSNLLTIDVPYSGLFLLEKLPYGNYKLIIEDKNHKKLQLIDISINSYLNNVKIFL